MAMRWMDIDDESEEVDDCEEYELLNCDDGEAAALLNRGKSGYHDDDAWTLPKEFNPSTYKDEFKQRQSEIKSNPTYGISNERNEYCYPCDTALRKKELTASNPYEDRIMQIGYSGYKCKLYAVVYKIFNYHCLSILPWSKKFWMPHVIYEHLTQHLKIPFFRLMQRVETVDKMLSVLKAHLVPPEGNIHKDHLKQWESHLKLLESNVKDSERIESIGKIKCDPETAAFS